MTTNLITGGAGFIGSNLAERLLDMGERVILLDNLSRPNVQRNVEWLRRDFGSRAELEVGDVRDDAIVRECVRQVDHVFHFAAQVAVTTSLADPTGDFDVNARGTLGVLEAVRSSARRPSLLFTSTNKVYGDRWDELVLSLHGRRGWLFVVPDRCLEEAAATLVQILTRYQRLAPRGNPISREPTFQAALQLHRALHDTRKPLVSADYDHALDVWQWTLRLKPSAGRALQLAALFHDVERLSSEADVRIEQHASDYQQFKDAHARAGARLASALSRSAGIAPEECAEIERLVEGHERSSAASPDARAQTLSDADALSFFSLNSPGFADYYGEQHTRKKVRYSLGRMSRRAFDYLASVKLRADIAAHVREAGMPEWHRAPARYTHEPA